MVSPGRQLVPAKLRERFEVLHLRIPRFLRPVPHRPALFLPVAPAVHLVVDEADRPRNRGRGSLGVAIAEPLEDVRCGGVVVQERQSAVKRVEGRREGTVECMWRGHGRSKGKTREIA